MSLIQLKQLSLSYGTQVLLDRVDYSLESDEQICLLGRNGVGKSTLLKILNGEISADDGQVQLSNNLIIAKLDQNLPEPEQVSCFDFMARAFADAQEILSAYHQLTLLPEPDDKQLEQLARLQQEIEHQNLWQIEQRIQRWLTEVSLSDTERLDNLSGGKLRLLALARALVLEPDVLLLDEPTNHLDIERIEWLEKRLPQWVKNTIFITHDRSFADRLATQIIELDRGILRTYPGNLTAYYRQKEHEEAAEANHIAEQDKKLAQEEIWIRQGIKARRTRNEGRVRALQALREEVKARRNKLATSQMTMSGMNTSGKLVAELSGVSKSFTNKTLFTDLDMTISRGDRLGILGNNGTGKSTLVKIILGELAADTGSVRLGTKLDIAYFDQKRSDIDLNKSVVDNIADGHQYVSIGERQVHVMSYLQQYLFSPDRARQPASALSGGELSRLSLAKLMARPFNLLVMDEPTNDLDMETLEVLENQLAEYKGTLILISHDRKFIDNTVTSVIHLDGEGGTSQCVGGYTDWVVKFKSAAVAVTETKAKKDKADAKPKARNKLSYHQQRELDQLPDQIETLEAELTQLQEVSMTPDFVKLSHVDTENHYTRMAEVEAEINTLYERWEELTA